MNRILLHGLLWVVVLLNCRVGGVFGTHLRALGDLPQPGSPVAASEDTTRPALCEVSLNRPARLCGHCANNYHEYKTAAIKVVLPEVQQPDEFSCGVAALMSILAYYGTGPEEYDDLKKMIGTTQKNGTDFHRIIRFAREQGLRADAKPMMTLAQLEKYLDEGKPVICSIQAYAEKTPIEKRAEVYKNDDNGHYLVAIGYDDDNVYFMDPSLTGRRGFLPKPEFEARWHDDEGPPDHPKPISHLGLVIWKPAGTSIYARFARRID